MSGYRNAELLNRVADVIEQHPDRYDQLDWGSGQEIESLSLSLDGQMVQIECGSAHCIAGWTCRLQGLRPVVVEDAYINWAFTEGGDSASLAASQALFGESDVRFAKGVPSDLFGATYRLREAMIESGLITESDESWELTEEGSEERALVTKTQSRLVAEDLRALARGEDLV